MDKESIIVGCTHCAAKNRIPLSRMNERAVCGKCKTPLSLSGRYPDRPVDINDRSFAAEVLNFPGPAVVLFWEPWCKFCQKMLPIVDQLASLYSGKIKFVRLLLGENPASGSQYRVQSVPAFILFKRGKPIDHLSGALPKEQLQHQLEKLL